MFVCMEIVPYLIGYLLSEEISRRFISRFKSDVFSRPDRHTCQLAFHLHGFHPSYVLCLTMFGHFMVTCEEAGMYGRRVIISIVSTVRIGVGEMFARVNTIHRHDCSLMRLSLRRHRVQAWSIVFTCHPGTIRLYLLFVFMGGKVAK